MSVYYRNKVKANYLKEAQAFRTRAEINTAYVNLKMEFDKLAGIIDRDDLPPEMFINADLSALVVELSDTIAKLSKRNANLLNMLKATKDSYDYRG